MDSLLYSRSIKITGNEYDVIVIGGGTAGSTAAIAAAMEGAKTLLVEKNCYLGGSASGGQVTPMMHTGLPQNKECSFINGLIKKNLSNEKAAADDQCGNDGWFNPEIIKFVIEEIYLKYGGQILYDTQFIDTIIENQTAKGVVVYNRGGLQLLKGKIIIDCTGDADVAYNAGVPCFVGDENYNKNQSSSLRFMTGNVDVRKLEQYLKQIGETMVLEYPFLEMSSVWESKSALTKVFQKAVDDGVLTYDDGKYFQAFTVPGMPGVISFNCPEIPDIYDSLNPQAITDIVITGKRMIKRIHKFLKIYLPGFEESYILSVASMPGIRESRRIHGKYVLTEEDYNFRAKFEDAIARTAYPIDIHGLIDEKKLDIKPMEMGEYFEIPFRCLVSETIDNIIAAGRCISSTFVAQSSIRIQATCRATGEAAGIAAAYCSKNSINVSRLDGRIIREKMKEKGVYL